MPALASPVYRHFIVAAFVGSIGNWMQSTAQGWLVLGPTESGARHRPLIVARETFRRASVSGG